ncbi:MAG: hypothetical protein ACRBDL_09330 [Alphaproteobacteria bacterium]
MHKHLMIGIITLVCVSAFLFIIQIWVPIMDWSTFIKLMITLGVLTALLGLFMIFNSDLATRKKLKDEDYLD